MDGQNIHSNKISLINWITRLQDKAILTELMNIQSNQENTSEFEVPKWHQEKVLKRIQSTKVEDYISIDDLDSLMS